jgi:hypothetical protein
MQSNGAEEASGFEPFHFNSNVSYSSEEYLGNFTKHEMC